MHKHVSLRLPNQPMKGIYVHTNDGATLKNMWDSGNIAKISVGWLAINNFSFSRIPAAMQPHSLKMCQI